MIKIHSQPEWPDLPSRRTIPYARIPEKAPEREAVEKNVDILVFY
jgi:hypothetical protein